MNVIGNMVAAATTNLRSLLGQPKCFWSGYEFPCVPGAERVGAQLEIGGTVVTVAVTLVMLRTQMTAVDHPEVLLRPVAGQTVLTFRDRRLRVIQVLESPDGEHVELDCEYA